MSAVSQLPINLSAPGTTPGFSQFGSVQPSGSDGSSCQPFSALLASMSPGLSERPSSPLTTRSFNVTGEGMGASSSSTFSGLGSSVVLTGGSDIEQQLAKLLHYSSSKQTGASQATGSDGMNLYADLISLFLNLSREAGSAGLNVSGSEAENSGKESNSDLLTKITKEASALLGVGLGTATANSSAASSDSVLNDGSSSDASASVSELVRRVLNDPAIQSDLEKLVKASEGGSAQTGYSSVLEDLMSRMHELESGLQANGSGKPAGMDAGNKNAAGAAAPSYTVGDLKELVNLITGKSSGGNSPAATMKVSAKAGAPAQDSGKSIHQLLQDLGNGAGLAASRKSAGGILNQNLSNAASLTAKAMSQKGEGQASSGKSLNEAFTGDLQTSSEAAPTTTRKGASAKVSSLSGNEAANAGKAAAKSQTLQTANPSGDFGKQDSTKSDGSQAGRMSRTLADAIQNTTGGATATSTFGQTLSAASHNTANVVDAKANSYQVSQTILRGVNMMNEGGKTVVTLKLQPESLGTVSLQVASDSGKISAQFNVGNADARAALEASIPQLRQILQSNGISLTHLSVNLSGGQSHSSHPQYQPRRQSHRFYTVVHPEAEDALRSFGYNTMEVKV